jgi:epoxyqueuosine reductase
MTSLGALLEPRDGKAPEWAPMGPEELPEPLNSYFKENEKRYKLTLKAFELIGTQRTDWDRFKTQFAIADAWSNAMASMFENQHQREDGMSLFPLEPKTPPEEWDFRGIYREKPLPFKSPVHASELIKKVAHTFGATLVGITKLNPDWCYQGFLRGVGPGE